MSGAAGQSLERVLAGLVAQVLAGDRHAYRKFLEALTPRLRAFLRRRLYSAGRSDPAEVEDVLQETLLAMHLSLHAYDPASPVTAWAHAIARHKLVDHLRRTGRHTGHGDIDTAEEVFSEASDAASDSRLDIHRAMAALPERTRNLIEQVKLRGYSAAEAAAATGMTETAVKVAVHRGLKVLARLLGAPDRENDIGECNRQRGGDELLEHDERIRLP